MRHRRLSASGLLIPVCETEPAHSRLKRGWTMKSILVRSRELLSSEDGPTTVEYAVMLAMVVGVAISVVTTVGTKTNALFENFNNEFGAAARS